ncbi:hypothetical protein EH220_02605 [bacterium]|nr:MAG: hypothetical protein EH220_02605 [bacterium]
MIWDALTFIGCLTFFIAHEIDATYRKEWRLLPLLRAMKDETAAAWFIALHVPIVFFLLALIALPDAGFAIVSRNVFCAFAVVHAGLHAFWPKSDLYQFDNAVSRSLIYGAGIFGALYFV